MGIQFRLGPNDHKQVEDFLSREHAGTDAITLDTKAALTRPLRRQPPWRRACGCTGNPPLSGLPTRASASSSCRCGPAVPTASMLLPRINRHAALVDLTVEKHPALVTHVTAPHFYVTDERTARLNVDLAERTRLAVGKDKPTRAVITVHAQRQVHRPQQGVRPHRRERGAALRSRAGTERQRQPDTAKATLDDIQLGNITLDDAKKQNKLTIDGQEASFNDFLGLLDTFPFWCNIVTP